MILDSLDTWHDQQIMALVLRLILWFMIQDRKPNRSQPKVSFLPNWIIGLNYHGFFAAWLWMTWRGCGRWSSAVSSPTQVKRFELKQMPGPDQTARLAKSLTTSTFSLSLTLSLSLSRLSQRFQFVCLSLFVCLFVGLLVCLFLFVFV